MIPPTTETRLAVGNRRRTSRLPLNGVAASRVPPASRIGGAPAPSTATGVPGLAGQLRQGALNQALAQVSNGALALVAQLSRRHVWNDCGHAASVHSVAE